MKAQAKENEGKEEDKETKVCMKLLFNCLGKWPSGMNE